MYRLGFVNLMSILKLRMVRRKFAVLRYQPSFSDTYGELVITPRPTKLEAARIVGTLFGWNHTLEECSLPRGTFGTGKAKYLRHPETVYYSIG